MEEKKTCVIRVLTDISESKPISDNSLRSFNKDTTNSPPSLDEIKDLQETKRLLQKKNQLHPLFANHPYRCGGFQIVRAASSRPKPKDVSQRIVSAKLLQIKELRNQLTLTQHQLNEVSNENRFLKTLQKRQEAALRKYEGHEAKLPQLIQTHADEIRVLNTKLKQVKLTNQRLVEKLKIAESQLSCLQQQHCHLVELSRDQQLGEREALTLKVQDLDSSLREKTNTIQLLTRKVDLERKNYKHELAMEKNRRTEVERKLSLAMQTIDNLKDQIEAKERCMNAIIPSRYARGAPSQPSLNSSRLTHTQNLYTPHKQRAVNTKSHSSTNINHVHVRTSMEQTDDELDVVELKNGKTSVTSDSSRTISGTTLPKIKPQMSSRTLRNQFKFSNKQSPTKNSSSCNETPDYSSSFTSVDISVKDLRKSSESEVDQILQEKQHILLNCPSSSRSRKHSVDSGVTNRSDSGKVTQRTDQSRNTSRKIRRNSVPELPIESTRDIEQYLEQESIAVKEEAQKNIHEELRELEEQLLQGSSILNRSNNPNSITAKAIKNNVNRVQRSDGSDSISNVENFYDDAWREVHDKVKSESEAAEAKLEQYYISVENSEPNLEDAVDYVALEQEQKQQLLKALMEIDREAGAISSASSTEDPQPSSSSHALVRRKSDGYSYNFSKNIENLHKGRPVCEKVKVPVIEKMKREEKRYLSDMEIDKKNKSDLMNELFGNLGVSIRSDSYQNERPKERERIVN